MTTEAREKLIKIIEGINETSGENLTPNQIEKRADDIEAGNAKAAKNFGIFAGVAFLVIVVWTSIPFDDRSGHSEGFTTASRNDWVDCYNHKQWAQTQRAKGLTAMRRLRLQICGNEPK